MSVYLAEIKGYDVLNSLEKTLYFSTESIVAFSSADADRANQFYEPRIKDIGSYQRSMFGSGRTAGQSATNAGTISIDNADGLLDYLQDWGFSGRSIKLYRGVEGYAFNTFDLILNATIKQPVFNYDGKSASTLDFTLVDRQAELDKPIQATLYLGTNSGATGNEGLPDDIKGQPKPLCFGNCFNITAVPCNTSALRYQVHDGAINAVLAVRDKGVALTYNATPAAGQYSEDLSTGIITLGSSPAGTVTADIEGAKPVTYLTTVADIAEHIIKTHGSIIAGDIDSTSLSALNTANSALVGLYINSEQSISSVLDELCASIGSYWLFNQNGVFCMGLLTAPTGAADYEINDIYANEVTRTQSSDEDRGVPVYLVKVDYKKNHTTQAADSLAGSVSDALRAELEKEFRTATDTDVSIQTAHLLSPQITRITRLAVEADAISESTRLLTLYKTRRYFYRLALPDLVDFATVDLGETVNLTLDRFGLDAGKLFLITSVTRNAPRIDELEIEVWG